MNANLDGRELLYKLYTQYPDLCRQAIGDIRRQTDKDYRRQRGPYLDGLLSAIRWQNAVQLSAIFRDPQQERAFLNFLTDKVNKKPAGIPLPICWEKLFDKIVDPTKGMKSAEAKRTSQQAKESPAILLQMWHERESQIIRVLEKHNREMAQLNFDQLVDEIDSRSFKIPAFQTALRYWARNSFNQPGGPRLQELLTIANFAKDFIAMLDEILPAFVQTSQNPQLDLLNRKLIAFLNEVAPIRWGQKGYMDRLTSKGLETQLPVGAIALSPHDISLLLAEGKVYDSIIQVPGRWVQLPAASDQSKKIQ